MPRLNLDPSDIVNTTPATEAEREEIMNRFFAVYISSIEDSS
jgi:hypothetical protein